MYGPVVLLLLCASVYLIDGQSTTPTTTPSTSCGSTNCKCSCACDTCSSTGPVLVLKRGTFGNPTSYFNRSWTEYETGFGDPAKEYFIGLKALNSLTSVGNWSATVSGIVSGYNSSFFYSTFKVGSAATFYQLTVGGYSTPPGQLVSTDGFAYHNGAAFSTYDQDHDETSANCALYWSGANWFKSCYTQFLFAPTSNMIYWNYYGPTYFIANATLVIRRL